MSKEKAIKEESAEGAAAEAAVRDERVPENGDFVPISVKDAAGTEHGYLVSWTGDAHLARPSTFEGPDREVASLDDLGNAVPDRAPKF